MQQAAAAAAAALSLRRAAVLGAHVPAAVSGPEAVLGPAQKQRVPALQRLPDCSDHIVRDRGSILFFIFISVIVSLMFVFRYAVCMCVYMYI